MPCREDVQVGMLIGTDCTKAIKVCEVIQGGDNDPYGIKTLVGALMEEFACLLQMKTLKNCH